MTFVKRNVIQQAEKGDFVVEMFSRNKWKQTAKNQENNKNFNYYTWLRYCNE